MIPFNWRKSPYYMRARTCLEEAREVKIGRIEISGRALLLSSLTACSLALTGIVMGEGSPLWGQIKETKWVAKNPPKALEALLAADKMAPMSMVSFEGRIGDSPVAKNLKANTAKFPGVEIKDGRKTFKAKVPTMKGGKKSLFPKFAKKKTPGGMKLVGQGGTKFKSPKGKKKDAIKVGPEFAKRKATNATKQNGGLYKMVGDSKSAAGKSKNGKLVFPKSKLAKFKTSLRQAKAQGTGNAKIAFPGSKNNKPAMFFKKARFERGKATKFKVNKKSSF